MEYITTIRVEDENCEGREVEVAINYHVTRERPATMYRSNGDPGDPAEGGELEIESIVTLDGKGEHLPDDVIDDETEFELYEAWDDGYDDYNAP